MTITIHGYGSFKEWADAGYPGAVSFDEHGNRKGERRTSRAICRLDFCQMSMVQGGLCLRHFEARQRRQLAGISA